MEKPEVESIVKTAGNGTKRWYNMRGTNGEAVCSRQPETTAAKQRAAHVTLQPVRSRIESTVRRLAGNHYVIKTEWRNFDMADEINSISIQVVPEHLACAVGSGDLDVLATPMMIAAM